MENLLLWRCVFYAAHQSSTTGDSFDPLARRALGSPLLVLRKDAIKLELKPGQPVSVPVPMLYDQTMWDRAYDALGKTDLAYLACLSRNNQRSPAGLDPILKQLDGWILSRIASLVFLRACTQTYDKQAHIERDRVLKAATERFVLDAEKKRFVGYSPYDFDDARKLNRKLEDYWMAGGIADSPKVAAATARRELKKKNGLAFFFGIEKGERKKEALTYMAEYIKRLHLERRSDDAAALDAFSKDPRNIVRVEKLYASRTESSPSVYVQWSNGLAPADERVAVLYREWILRRDGYVVAADPFDLDPRDNNNTKLKASDTPCGHEGILRIAEDLGLAMTSSRASIDWFLWNHGARQVGDPPEPLEKLLLTLDASGKRAQSSDVSVLDQEYATTILKDSRSYWFANLLLPRARENFVRDYYALVEPDPKHPGKAREDVAAPLRALERVSYRALLREIYDEIRQQLESFSDAIGNYLSNFRTTELQDLKTWYRATSGFEARLDSFPAYSSTGTSAPLLREFLERAVRKPIVLNRGRSDEFNVPISIEDALGRVRPCVDKLLIPAIAALDSDIERTKLGETKFSAKDDEDLRESVLLLRNYFLDRLVLPDLRSYVITAVDNMWAEHLADSYSTLLYSEPLWQQSMTPAELTTRSHVHYFRRPTVQEYANGSFKTLRQQFGYKDWPELQAERRSEAEPFFHTHFAEFEKKYDSQIDELVGKMAARATELGASEEEASAAVSEAVSD